ncbi:MAG: YggT family protein [Gemmatimonadales bacterium]
MPDRKVAADEARRATQHEQVKAEIERDVNREMTWEAEKQSAEDADQVSRVASELRGKAVREVEVTEQEIERGRGVARLSQVVDYVFYVIYALLGIRLALALLAARPGAGFVRFIRAVTDPLYAPFQGILPNLTAEGGHTFASSVLFAIGIYILLHLGVKGLLRVIAQRRTTV